MPNRNLSELYQEVIRRHDRTPFHYSQLAAADYIIEAYNPLCGDQYRLFLQINEGVIAAAHFHGYGCAISKASTSVLIQKIEGMTIESILNLVVTFQRTVQTGEPAQDEELDAFAAARHFPERLTCATLSWDALQDFLARLAKME